MRGARWRDRLARSFRLLGSIAALGFAICSSTPAAGAGLELSWDPPGSQSGGNDHALGCSDADSVAVIYATFQVPDSIPKFIALTAILEIRAETDTLPAFWQLWPESKIREAGCNLMGLVLSKVLPPESGPEVANPWGDFGSETIGYVQAGEPRPASPSASRMACLMVRTTPTPLVPGQTYFGFALRLFMDRASESGGSCEGCRVPVTIKWLSAVFEREGGESSPFKHPLEVVQPGPRGACACANHASLEACGRQKPSGSPPEAQERSKP